MPETDDDIFSIRDIIDSQLETSDGKRIGRVADIEAEWQEDGSLVLCALLIGPQATAGRVAEPLGKLLRLLLRDRFEQRIPMSAVESIGPTIRLRGTTQDYGVGQSERWITEHILRWIPGNGR